MVPNELGSAVVNHLWQSTVVVCGAWLLAMALRKNHARVRYWVWFAASMKFLVPFSALMTAGEWARTLMPATAARPAMAQMVDQVAEPFGQTQFFDAGNAPVAAHEVRLLPWVLAVWACGALVVAVRFGRGWWRAWCAVRVARKTSNRRSFDSAWRENAPVSAQDDKCNFAADVPVLVSSSLIEPGIFGIFRPVLLLPEGIMERLTAEQMRAVVGHEMEHVRRRDNLTFALHMVVEALFWFHPAVWWIGARLIEERERACDEAVVATGGAAQTYAEGILNVCKFYVESPVECVAGVTGSDLKKRIVRIMMEVPTAKLSFRGKLLVSVIGAVMVVAPLSAGLVIATEVPAQLLEASGPLPSFEVATIKPSQDTTGRFTYDFEVRADVFAARNVPLARLIRFAYNVKSDSQVEDMPRWASMQRFDVDAKIPEAQVDAIPKLRPDQRFEQYQFMLQSLLANRFSLRVSTRMKRLPAYALVVEKRGAKMTAVAVSPDPRKQHFGTVTITNSGGELTAKDLSTARLCQWLSGTAESGDRIVLDETGLNGRYDFTLRWTPVETGAPLLNGSSSAPREADVAAADSSGPSLFTALEEQLGLKLVPMKAPVEVLVIDHVERPSAN